jgi:hypothetical protein
MSKRYPGNFITGNPVALSQTSNNGVWDVKDVSAAVNAGTWQEPDGVYEIPRSLRFKNASGTSLTRTAIAAGNRKNWTWSAWIKRSKLGTFSSLFSVNNSAGSGDEIGFRDTDTLQFATNGGTQVWLVTSQLFRDTSAWYHIVCTLDTTQSIANNRAKIYVNGVQVTALGTNTQPSLNADTTNFNTTSSHSIGSGYTAFDGYMAEVSFVDGSTLDASYFGYFDPITNIWQPKKYTGTYGVNGFYLPFNNPTTTASLGWDYVTNPDPKFTFAQGSGMTFNTSTFKYGGSSMYFSGAAGGGTSLSANSQYGIGTGQFCIEAWIYPETGHAGPAGNSFSTIISQGNNASNVLWALSLPDATGANTTSRLQWGFTGATTITTATMTLNAWHHVMVSRDASNVERIFIDGVLVNQRTNTTNYNNVSAYNTNIGFMYDSNYPGAYGTSSYGNVMKGFINDLRLTIGAIPVPYQTSSVTTGTTIFTPPTSALPIGPQSISDPRYWNNVAFHMPFNGGGTAAFPVYTKGAWTSNNFSITAGAAYDSMVDSPTNIFTSATDVGGVVTGNYATWNALYALNLGAGAANTLTNGNLTSTDANSASYNGANIATIGVSSGKWYWEVTNTTASTYVPCNGIAFSSNISTEYSGISYVPYQQAIQVRVAGSNTNLQTSVGNSVNGDVIGMALDADNKTITFYKNNAIVGAPQSYSSYQPTNPVFPAQWTVNQQGQVSAANFGQRAFAYTPPAGYKSLNTTNLQAMGTSVVGKAALQANKWFDINTFMGSTIGSDTAVVNSGFQPNFVWIKARSHSQNNYLLDSVRGSDSVLRSNTSGAETLYPYSMIFNSNGFTPSSSQLTTVGYNYVGWQWKQSPTSGFNIVSYVGTGSNQNITHNLGVAPSVVLVKSRNGVSKSWNMWHKALAATDYVYLEQTGGVGTDATKWNSTAPTSSVFTVGTQAGTNASGENFIAYVWADVPGFSSFGSYIGNGSADGTFVHTGFCPKYVMIKRTTGGTSHWTILDTVRDPNNNTNNSLYANLTNAEDVNATDQSIDTLSNGFKIRASSNWETNTAGSQYIFAAFAESPFALNNRAR